MPPKNQHMSPEEFRKNGYTVVDWIATYLEEVEKHPCSLQWSRATSHPDAGAGAEAPEAFGELLADLDRVVMLGSRTGSRRTGWPPSRQHVAPSVLAEFAAAGLGVQGMLWSTSPPSPRSKCVILDWLVDMLSLPPAWKSDGPGGGVIQMSASDATHAILVVARHQRRDISRSENMVIYVSDQTHSSIEKGCTIAGIGHCRKIETDSTFAMDASCLEASVAADVAAGLTPIAVVSSVGTTATTAVDPIRAVDAIAKQYKLWHHVDAAYAGTAMVCPEFRHFQDGVELVDSYTFNPHKWMMVNFDCNVLWVADRAPLIDTMSILPPYLRNQASNTGAVVDYRDWHVPLGRRFRALKLWWVIRSYGVEGIRNLVRHHVRLAEEFAAWIDADNRFELFAPHPFSLVCFSHVEGDDATKRLAAALNASGKVAVTPSVINDRSFIRVSIGQTHTDEVHVQQLQVLINELA